MEDALPFILFVAFYVYFAIVLVTIAKKTGLEHRSWWGWIPILNVLLMIQVAGKQWWWILLFLIPLVNIAISVIIWWEIAKRRNKPGWLGLLMLVPIANIIVPGYIAFADTDIQNQP